MPHYEMLMWLFESFSYAKIREGRLAVAFLVISSSIMCCDSTQPGWQSQIPGGGRQVVTEKQQPGLCVLKHVDERSLASVAEEAYSENNKTTSVLQGVRNQIRAAHR